MKPDKYNLIARVFPSGLTAIPLLILVNSVLNVFYHDSLKNIANVIPILTHLSVSAAAIFLLIQIIRFIGKELFESIIFKNDTHKPSVNHLLWKDDFLAKGVKALMHQKILNMYNLQLLDEIQEQNDEKEARKMIRSAVGQIRNSLRTNHTVRRHNFEYGFFRNLIGGCVLAIISSIAVLVYSLHYQMPALKITAIILLVIYFIPILTCEFFIKKYGNYYSSVLCNEFLSLP